MTSCGHFRSAIVTGMAARMPSFFAGIDAAAMILRRSPGSPETTDGTSRMSCPPSRTIFTAVQLRKAEFTSIWKMTRVMTAAGRLFGGGLRGLHPVLAVLEGDLVQREDPRGIVNTAHEFQRVLSGAVSADEITPDHEPGPCRLLFKDG